MNEAPMLTTGATMLETTEYDADTEAGTGAAEEDSRARTVSTYTATDPEDDSCCRLVAAGRRRRQVRNLQCKRRY